MDAYSLKSLTFIHQNLQSSNLLMNSERNGILIDHEMAIEINEYTISNLKEGIWDDRYRYHLFYQLLKNSSNQQKENYFNEFEFYLQNFKTNKFKEIFQQLKELGFSDLWEDLIQKFFSFIIDNPCKIIKILKDSIK